jgi:hypothetical protein
MTWLLQHQPLTAALHTAFVFSKVLSKACLKKFL